MVGGLFGSNHSRSNYGRRSPVRNESSRPNRSVSPPKHLGDSPSRSSAQTVKTIRAGNSNNAKKNAPNELAPTVVDRSAVVLNTASSSQSISVNGVAVRESSGNSYVPPPMAKAVFVEVDTDLNNVNVQEPSSNLVASRSRLLHIMKRTSSSDDVRHVETEPTSNVVRHPPSQDSNQISGGSYKSHRTPPFIKRIPQGSRGTPHRSSRGSVQEASPGGTSRRAPPVKEPFLSEEVEEAVSYDSVMGATANGDFDPNLTATDLAAGQLLRWKMEAEEGPIVLQILAFTLAIGCIVTTLYPIVSDNTYINPSSIIGAFHTINLCSIILIFELRCSSSRRSQFNVRAKVRALASRYFNILRLLWGRGLLYLFAGSMNWAIGHPYCIFTAWLLMSTGVLAILAGSRASFNLDRLRASVTDEVYLWTKFDAVDDDNDEHIDIDGFASLVWSLGLQIGDTYTFRAFSQIDKDNDGLISLDEFKAWWFEGKELSKKWWVQQTK
jgi:hypothetical protein